MNTKTTIIWIIIAIIVGLGGFFGGMAYAKGQTSGSTATTSTATGRFGSGRGGFGGASGGATGGTAGTIISQSSGSLTIELRSGSSQIILYSTSTPVLKTTEGSTSDLTPGEEVTVIGSTNSDGSMTAQSIQLRSGINPNASSTPSTPAQ